MISRTPPKEVEVSAKIRINGEKKKDQKDQKDQKEAQPVEIVTRKIQIQKVSRQENKTIAAGRRFEVHKETADGFLQSFFLYWSGTNSVPNIDIQLDLGKHGSFTVNYEEYFNAGLIAPHSAQDFWIAKKDDTGKNYCIAMTPAVPIKFDGLRVIIENKNDNALTVGIIQVKFYIEIEEEV